MKDGARHGRNQIVLVVVLVLDLARTRLKGARCADRIWEIRERWKKTFRGRGRGRKIFARPWLVWYK